MAEPRTSQGFIDRFLLTAEAYHIPAILVFNKTDLLKPKHRTQLEAWKAMYERAGYQVFAVAAVDPKSLGELAEKLKGRTTLFSGHSGVGKSTLINQLIPSISLKTTEVSGWSGKGQHTTTFAEMFIARVCFFVVNNNSDVTNILSFIAVPNIPQFFLFPETLS